VLVKVISGGEPGAEQAALDAAMDAGLEHGGWIPAGRATEAGSLPDEFLLAELSSEDPEAASERNVEEADGTVVFFLGRKPSRCVRAAELSSRRRKPLLEVDLDGNGPSEVVQALAIWLRLYEIAVLHVTGPRASEEFRAYARVRAVMSLLMEPPRPGCTPVLRTAFLRSGPRC